MSRPATMSRSGWLALSAMVIGVILMAVSLAAQSGAVESVSYGTVVSAKPVQIQSGPTQSKAAAGAAVGAVAGACLARPGRHVGGAIVGGLAGAAIGSAASQPPPPKPGTELVIRLDNGQEIAIKILGQQAFMPGDRVRMISGSSGTKVERVE